MHLRCFFATQRACPRKTSEVITKMSNMAIFTIWSFFKGHEVNLHTLEKSFKNNWLACDWGRKALPRATLCASGHILLHKAPWDIRVLVTQLKERLVNDKQLLNAMKIIIINTFQPYRCICFLHTSMLLHAPMHFPNYLIQALKRAYNTILPFLGFILCHDLNNWILQCSDITQIKIILCPIAIFCVSIWNVFGIFENFYKQIIILLCDDRFPLLSTLLAFQKVSDELVKFCAREKGKFFRHSCALLFV